MPSVRYLNEYNVKAYHFVQSLNNVPQEGWELIFAVDSSVHQTIVDGPKTARNNHEVFVAAIHNDSGCCHS